ncbi:Elicitor-responsive protein 3 [Melia azedarach]|uniref:Elicitor-responsive protein 3 n=1 Tax=Melia azedarach TaxID=155640 RepID=A0ACC1WRM2_MELAZ|nr:Elicitor-responsive protein 3 [Melia azedarach]
MSISGIQGLPLEVTVVGCYNLDDKEWISRQDPYVCLEYGSTKYRTKTCTDGGKNPTFQEKFVFPLIEGLRELSVVVWNSHTLKPDEFIGSGRIQLHKVLSQGFDDAGWPLQSKTSRHSGEIRLILHYSSSHQSTTKVAPSAPQYATPSGSLSQVLLPGFLSQASAVPYPPTTAYTAPTPYTSYPPQPATYPPSPYPPAAPAPPVGYPTQTFPPAPAVYHPQPYPPPPQGPTYYPPGPPSGIYPPPPY